MSKLIRMSLCALAAAWLLSACETLTVKSDVNTALIGSVHCRSFAFAGSFTGTTDLRASIANPVNESRLRAAIASHLAGSGMQQVASDADCVVGYGIGSRTVVEGAYPYGWGWGPGYWGPGYWGPGPWGWYGGYGGWYGPYVYHEGVIAVDLFEAKSHQAIWHASVNQNLTGATGADAEKKINEAVALLFTKYPG